MKKTMVLTGIILFAGALLAAGCGAPSGSVTSSHTGIRGISGGLPPTGAQSVSTIAEAIQSTGMNIRVPRDTLGGAPTAVKTVAADKELGTNTYIYCTYSNGMNLNAESSPQVDYAAQIANMEQLNRTASIHPDKLPYLVTVAGHQGMLWPAHMNQGDTQPGVPVLYWWDSGVSYSLYPPGTSSPTGVPNKTTVSPDTESTTINTLLKVANSMY